MDRSLVLVRPVSFLWSGLQNAARWPIIPIILLTVLAVVGSFGPLMAPRNPYKVILREKNAPPVWYARGSWQHILGADPLGRDVLSRMIYGTRETLQVASVALVVGTLVGVFLGLVAGYIGGHVEEVIMRVVDMWLGLPFLLVAMVIVVVLGGSMTVIIAVLALLAWPGFVRLVRAEVLSLKTRDYVSLAKVAGASNFRILHRHILPGVINTIIVIATLRVGQLILAEAALSYLGAGIPPPHPTWGGMVSDGRNYMADAWWISFFPGAAIFLTVFAFNFLGDWMRDHFDPRLRQL